jgi:signal transduction histidine kinase
VLANLLDNAVRHARSQVLVAVDAGGSQVRISISDDGPGIPAADRQRVFNRFTRLDDARSDDGGAGLGLAIVAELLHRHHGTITLADADADADADAAPGLRAEVSLPAARPDGFPDA